MFQLLPSCVIMVNDLMLRFSFRQRYASSWFDLILCVTFCQRHASSWFDLILISCVAAFPGTHGDASTAIATPFGWLNSYKSSESETSLRITGSKPRMTVNAYFKYQFQVDAMCGWLFFSFFFRFWFFNRVSVFWIFWTGNFLFFFTAH